MTPSRRCSEYEVARITNNLTGKRDEIAKSAENLISQPPPSDPCADDLDYASRSTIQRMAFVLKHRRQEKVRQIEDALDRLKTGSFGICTECEEPISRKRLETTPDTRLCFKCQEAEENARCGRIDESVAGWLLPYRFCEEDDGSQ